MDILLTPEFKEVQDFLSTQKGKWNESFIDRFAKSIALLMIEKKLSVPDAIDWMMNLVWIQKKEDIVRNFNNTSTMSLYGENIIEFVEKTLDELYQTKKEVIFNFGYRKNPFRLNDLLLNYILLKYEGI